MGAREAAARRGNRGDAGSGAIFYYTDFPIVRWDHVDGDALRSLERVRPGRTPPLYAVLFPFDFDAQVRDGLRAAGFRRRRSAT